MAVREKVWPVLVGEVLHFRMDTSRLTVCGVTPDSQDASGDEIVARKGAGMCAACSDGCGIPLEPVDVDDDESEWAPDFGGPTVGYCSKCGEARDAFYTCRGGGETVTPERR